MLADGVPAPEFALPDQSGRVVRLADLRGGPVVLFFYPGDFTPICTAEVCSFRDQFAHVRGLEAPVLGVSRDSVDSHREFAHRHRLPFRLLSDGDGSVCRAYDAWTVFGAPARVTYVIDAEGRVAWGHRSELFAASHPEGAKKALARLGVA